MSQFDLARVRQELRCIDLALVRAEHALDLPRTASRVALPMPGPSGRAEPSRSRRYLELGTPADPELVALADDVKTLFAIVAIALGRVERMEGAARSAARKEAS